MNLIKLNEDILIEIQKYIEINDIRKLTLVHSIFYKLFKKYRNNIYIHLFKQKGFSFFLTFFIKSRKSNIYINDFYKMDKLLRINNNNIIRSFKMKHFVLTKFILSNYNIKSKIVEKYNYESLYNILYYRKPIDEHLVNDIFVELIRFRFSTKMIDDNTLDMLIIKSKYSGNIDENIKQQLRSDIINILNLLDLSNFHSIMYNLSSLLGTWKYWLKETGDGSTQKCKIYKLLSLY